MMESEIKSQTPMREGIQNLSITIKIINLKSDIKNGTSVGYNYDHNGNTTENL